MISGPRAGQPKAWRRWLASILARELQAFVVPGPELLDALGLDADGAGLRLVASPRQASVLMLVGEISPGLSRAAAVVYAQMPRPRAILAVGTASPARLPAADLSVEPDQTALVGGVAHLRRRMAEGAWAADPRAFEPDAAREPTHDEGQSAHGDMASMDHGDMGGGFMSMVMVTATLPRGDDGLPMEWLEVPFGPLHPGLPGGLMLSLTLDGDTVVQAEVGTGTLERDLSSTWSGSVMHFADSLGRLDPLAPRAYAILAWRALEAVAGIASPDEHEAHRRIASLERERAVSHLIWLGRFGFLLGDAWLAQRSSACARQLARTQNATDMRELRKQICSFLAQVRKTPLLRQRLGGVGVVDSALQNGLPGPVARAGGLGVDARSGDAAYQQLGFAPELESGGDARARCWVRLAEIEQSLDLVLAAGADCAASAPILRKESGSAQSTLETPRGSASLRVTVADGQITSVHLTTPSSALVALVEHVAAGRELSDALLGVASLDLSPWELDR